MFKVMMLIDGEAYEYGRWNDKDTANKVAMEVGEEREVETYIEEAN